jgi:hypothetical protein
VGNRLLGSALVLLSLMKLADALSSVSANQFLVRLTDAREVVVFVAFGSVFQLSEVYTCARARREALRDKQVSVD